MRHLRISMFFVIVFAGIACGTSHGGVDGGSGMDGSTADAAHGSACGPATCAVGQVCCNESCGICTAPGEGCIALECLDGGAPPADSAVLWLDGGPDAAICGDAICGEGSTCCGDCDGNSFCIDGSGCPLFPCPGGDCVPTPVRAQGPCDAILGYRWNGRACEALSGCSCDPDCDGLHPSFASCETAFASCPVPVSCGGLLGTACAATEYCDYLSATVGCGASDQGGFCRSRPTACDANVDPVCACDGQTYSNECQANAAGFDISRAGACTGG